MKYTIICCWLGVALCTSLLGSCGLEQDIDLELPPYEPQPSIEAYLTPGEPFSLLITRTSGFFDPLELDNAQFLENLLLDNADVRIRYGDREVRLDNQIGFNPRSVQISNYRTSELVPENYVDSFYLSIRFADGTEAQAATLLLPPVPFDSSVVSYPDPLIGDTIARIFSYITDPDLTKVNRFRRLLTYNPIDSSVLQDFVFTDEQASQVSIPTGTIFYFNPGDTIYIYNAHVDERFEKYLLSTQLAEQSNGNPFAQPSSILGNVSGSANPLGIFTSYAYVIDTVYIPEP